MSNLTDLQTKLEEYNTSYADHFKSPTLLAALHKTFTSHNITFEEWNTLVDSIKDNLELTPQSKAILEDIEECLEELYSNYIRTSAYYTFDSKKSPTQLNYNVVKSADIDGHVFRVSGDGMLGNQDGTNLSVSKYSHVYFVWNGGDWYWKTLTISDGMVDQTSDQTILGAKTFNSGKLIAPNISNGTYLFTLPSVSSNKTLATTDDVTSAIASAVSNVYKFMGSYIVSELNALDVDSSFNGNVYNVQDSGTLQGWGGYTTVVNPGDNVAIVYPENGHWYWDKLASTIDLSAYALKTEATALYKHTMVLQDDGQQNWNVVIISPVSTPLTSGSINSDVINFFARYDWYGFIAIASGSSTGPKSNIIGYLTDTGEQVYLSFVNISNEIMQVEFWTVISDSVAKI